jgi:hypothetical protein
LQCVVWSDLDSPSGVVDGAVMGCAEEYSVLEVSLAALFPGFYVVCLAPAWWSITAGEGAALVAVGEGDALCPGEQPVLTP